MEVMTLPDELLFPVLTGICGGFQIHDFRRLEGRTQKGTGLHPVICFLPHRALVDPVGVLYRIATGKRGAGRMARFVLHKHAETCNRKF